MATPTIDTGGDSEVTCDIINGHVPTMEEYAHTWPRVGRNGIGMHQLGKRPKEGWIRAVKFNADTASAQAWFQAIEALVNKKTLTITRNDGASFENVVIRAPQRLADKAVIQDGLEKVRCEMLLIAVRTQ